MHLSFMKLLPPPWHDVIIREQPSQKLFAQKSLSPHEKLFWEKNPPIL